MTKPALHDAVRWMKNWIAHVVIGESLCPFARASWKSTRIIATKSAEPEALLRDVENELDRLIKTPEDRLSTTVMVVPHALYHFTDYLDMLALIEMAIEDAGLCGEIQVASFHPQYQFDGTDVDDPANWTNRSPVPAFHFLREDHVADARAKYHEIEKVPARNIAHFRALGRTRVQSMLDSCFAEDGESA